MFFGHSVSGVLHSRRILRHRPRIPPSTAGFAAAPAGRPMVRDPAV